MTVKERNIELRKFVEQNISVCQTLLVEKCFQESVFSTADIQNLYKPFDGQLLLPNTCASCKKQALCLDSETGECEGCFTANQSPQEIYEWWAVSLWFGRKLLMEGQPLLENEYGVWWGRCCSGQAVHIDYIIQKIFDELMR